MSPAPKLRRLVMFKHGVAHVERSGPADGPFELRVRRGEVNDVLKSLTAVVLEGDARVGAVTFDSADDPAEELSARNLLPAPGETLATVVAAVRGRRVIADDGARHEGEVLGIEATPIGEGAWRRQIVLRTADGAITLVDLGALRRLELLDPSSRADIDLLVDKSRAMTAGDARLVRVDVVGKTGDLRVGYIVPAPTWRVSYRVAIDDDDGGALILAWAIVHNPADEDVEDVELILTTGQPVSFEIDLARPKRLQRPVVEEQERTVSAPRRIEPDMRQKERRMAPMPPPMAASFGAPAGFAAPQAMAAHDLADALEQQGAGAAELGERGELFEYRVANPVSLRRGGSAMVPIASARIALRKDLVWRQGSPPAPDRVLGFANATGAVLEEGPAVVYEGGGYAGEAMLPYAARGAEVRFVYAKDLAVRCSSSTVTRDRATGVRLLASVVVEDQLREWVHTFRIENDHHDAARVLLELPIQGGRTLRAGEVAERTASALRFAVEAPAHGVAELEVIEGKPFGRQVAWGDLRVHQLAAWLDRRFLDQQIAGRLRAIVEQEDEARRLEALREVHIRLRTEKQEEIQRLAQQLGVLAQQGPEGHLRIRYAEQMEAAQRAVGESEMQLRQLERGAQSARAEGLALLRALVETPEAPP